MELSDHEKTDEILALTRDNNRILHRMRRNMVWGHVFTFLYWLVILGGIGWSYYYLDPYITRYWDVYQSMMQTLDSIQQNGSSLSSDLRGLLEKAR